jgi:hypothetical protein
VKVVLLAAAPNAGFESCYRSPLGIAVLLLFSPRSVQGTKRLPRRSLVSLEGATGCLERAGTKAASGH